MHGAYFLYKRKLKKGIVWYYKAYKPDGTLSTGKSTGQTSKQNARAYCDNLLQRGFLFNGISISFQSYASGWFSEGSSWLENKLIESSEDSPSISKRTLYQYELSLNKHILPYFGHLKMNEITPNTVKSFRTMLLNEKGISRGTINNVVKALKIILDTALADDVMVHNAMRGITSLRENCSTRDAFTYEEAVKIFDYKWQDKSNKLLMLVAALTGMRIGELLAIGKDRLHEKYIDVSLQNFRGTLISCKTKIGRKVPIPKLFIG